MVEFFLFPQVNILKIWYNIFMDIIEKLKNSGLTGRGGAEFPTYLKWTAVKKEKAEKKYIICNASEGELNTHKDKYILDNHGDELMHGIKIALDFLDNSEAYIYIKDKYYDECVSKLNIKDLPIKFFKKTGGYIAGEETALLNAMEGKPIIPRIKPPYPTQLGLHGYPTLINNVETFWSIGQIAEGKYLNERFYSISGDINYPGVYKLGETYNIEDVLKETKNYPKGDFFVQAGGGASGEILLPTELNKPIQGVGSIVVYDRKKTDPYKLMEIWAKFFYDGNCDKCLPCREGIYRIYEAIKDKDLKDLKDIFLVMEKSSLCALGRIAPTPFKDIINKII